MRTYFGREIEQVIKLLEENLDLRNKENKRIIEKNRELNIDLIEKQVIKLLEENLDLRNKENKRIIEKNRELNIDLIEKIKENKELE